MRFITGVMRNETLLKSVFYRHVLRLLAIVALTPLFGNLILKMAGFVLDDIETQG